MSLLRSTVRRGMQSPRRCAGVRQSSARAFAFDIDGVLLKGGDPIPGATEALQLLKAERVPFILLTNGGGKSEADRTSELSDKLGTEIHVDQFIQSHTPFRLLADRYDHVCVLGGSPTRVRDIAEGYGFKSVVSSLDIVAKQPHVWPFHKTFPEEYQHARDFDEHRPFDAVFVFCDPFDLGLETQLIVELLGSQGGRLGTVSTTGKEGPPIYFSNPDLVWANQYPIPRLGQGALQASINAILTQMFGHGLADIGSTVIGKPHKFTYDYASRVLGRFHETVSATPLQTVFMVGDNPESDIRGANSHGWASMLVRTGVFRGDGNSAKYPAKFVCQDVYEAVQRAMAE